MSNNLPRIKSVEESDADFSRRLSMVFGQSRADAKVSQEHLALELGVSKKTIQAWETGDSSPSLLKAAKWFRALGINPLYYFLHFLVPENYKDLPYDAPDENVNKALHATIDTLPPLYQRQILYVIAGNHGSSFPCVLQMIIAHLHTTMRSRVAAARTILESYEIETESKALTSTDGIMPNLDQLRDAVDSGKEAAKKNNNSYTLF